MNSTSSSPDDGSKATRRRALLTQLRSAVLPSRQVRLGQLAVEKGYLRSEELDELLRTQAEGEGDEASHAQIGALLLQKGILSPEQIVDLLREQRRRNLLSLFDQWSEGGPEEVLRFLADPSRHLDDYVLIRKIGSGGTGTVWKAWDQKLRRWVAVKILRGETGPELRRFLREAYAAGRLRHPNLISVHKVSEHEGRPFLVMDFIDGSSLEGRLMEPLEATRLMIIISRAMHYAHQRGVIHRDLKPANLLVDDRELAVAHATVAWWTEETADFAGCARPPLQVAPAVQAGAPQDERGTQPRSAR